MSTEGRKKTDDIHNAPHLLARGFRNIEMQPNEHFRNVGKGEEDGAAQL